jgi:hypothetical protein
MLAGLSWLIGTTNDSQSVTNSLSVTQHSSATPPVQFVPIEELRVGDRVMANNPESSQVEPATDTQADPRTWRHIVLEADYRWADGTADPIHVETLQPPDWIAMEGAEIGRVVDLPLDLVEMGLPADLRARVLENRSCPPLAPTPGRLVLTTVNHLHNRVLELQVRDEHGGHETLRPTSFHKFYSQTRRAWVSTEDLQPDEVLAGLRGSVTVVSTAAVPGIHRVYSLTVEGEHVYHVSERAVAAHNNDCSAPAKIIEGHHQLPTQFADKFKNAGLNIQDFKIPLEQGAHRLKPGGLHTIEGGNWNGQWKQFFTDNPNAQAPEILEQLARMRNAFGLE